MPAPLHRLVLIAALLGTSCELPDSSGGSSPAKKTTPTATPASPPANPPAAPPAATAPTTRRYLVGTVGGTWLYKTETMVLKQKGASLQGTTAVPQFKQDPNDPVELPAPTVGTVDEKGSVRLDELVNYTKNPKKSFIVRKVGGLTDANTLVLDVVAGQTAHTQTWVRAK
jgi:hypothetical protein